MTGLINKYASSAKDILCPLSEEPEWIALLKVQERPYNYIIDSMMAMANAHKDGLTDEKHVTVKI